MFSLERAQEFSVAIMMIVHHAVIHRASITQMGYLQPRVEDASVWGLWACIKEPHGLT